MNSKRLPRFAFTSRAKTGLALLTLASFAGSSFLHAQTNGSWITDGGGNWSDAPNWTSNPAVPGGAGSIVNLTNDITVSSTVTVDTTSRTVGTLNIGDANGSNAFRVTGNSLIFDNNGSGAILAFTGTNVLATGTNVVASALSLSDNLDLKNGTERTQTISGTISAGTAGTKTITNNGTGTGTTRIANVISDGAGAVAVTQNSTTSALLLTGANTFTGGFTLSAGSVSVSGISALGGNTNVVTLNGGIISNANNGTVTINNAITLGGDVDLQTNPQGAGEFQINGLVTLTGNRELTIAGTVNKVTTGFTGGAYSLTKAGNGTLILGNGSNSNYTGGTFITGGTLSLIGSTAGNRLSSTGAVTVNGGTLHVAVTHSISREQGVGDLTLASGSITGAATDYALHAASYTMQSGTASKILGGTGTLTKNTLGTVVLSGSNSYTGTTSVDAGILLINGNSSGATGDVTVSSGATLGGSGIVGGQTTVSGIIAPGEGIGTLSFTNGLSWNGAATIGSDTDWKFELGPSNTADLVAITGDFQKAVSLGDVFRFDFSESSEEGIYTLVQWTGGTSFDASDFSYTNLAGGKSGSFSIQGTELVFTVVPEPGTCMLLGMGAALALWRRRRTVA